MKSGVLAILLVGTVVLAAVVGLRMGKEAMAVVVGVVCGVAASIPMSLLILLITSRRQQEPEGYGYGQGRQAYPPVVVIQGGQPVQGLPRPLPGGTGVNLQEQVTQREFRVVGAPDQDVG